jgi:hypothetical protein
VLVNHFNHMVNERVMHVGAVPACMRIACADARSLGLSVHMLRAARAAWRYQTEIISIFSLARARSRRARIHYELVLPGARVLPQCVARQNIPK